ncbi:MAG: hypothetical protein ABIY70_27120 [Capsulimonas sp.]|uniref:hypothetical protein n=1 Tax=Capsulimonas sp. TaxID=2494211 RepID=UPI003266DA2A
MPSAALIDQLVDVAARRLGGNLRLLALYGSAADNPLTAHDLDFFLVVDAVENCVTYATRDCRDLYPNVQFFVVNSREYEILPAFYRFQFAFAKQLRGNLTLPEPNRRDAEEAIRHGFTDTLRTMRQQFKRREWAAGDDWARQVWWNLKSFKYATLDVCWLIRKERTRDVNRAALILEAEGMNSAAKALSEWPELEAAAQQLLTNPKAWLMRWEPLITAAYLEIMPLLTSK